MSNPIIGEPLSDYLGKTVELFGRGASAAGFAATGNYQVSQGQTTPWAAAAPSVSPDNGPSDLVRDRSSPKMG